MKDIMMTEKIISLGDICRIFTGKKDVNQTTKTGKYSFYSCSPNKLLSDEYLYDGEAIIIAGNGSYTGRVLYANEKFDLYQRTYACVLKDEEENISTKYLYYYLKAKFEPRFIGGTRGSSIPYIVKGDISDFQIHLPSLEKQHEISSVLSNIDNKITNNIAINDNLYAILQAVYQETFTHTKSTNQIGMLSDICCYAKEKIEVSKLDVESYFSTENMLPEKKGASIATQLPTVSKVTACHKGDTLISNIRPYFKKIVYSEMNCGCSTDVLCFSPKQPKYSSYLFCTLFEDNFFAFMVAGSKGTKMPRGDKAQIMTYPVGLPTEHEIDVFNELSQPILRQINTNHIENRYLVSLRDGLLKKLISDSTR